MKVKVGNIYHCKTEEDAKDLLSKLHELGYTWRGDESSLLSKNYWSVYEKETCYRVTFGGIFFGSRDSYIEAIKDGLDGEIIEYKKGDKL